MKKLPSNTPWHTSLCIFIQCSFSWEYQGGRQYCEICVLNTAVATQHLPPWVWILLINTGHVETLSLNKFLNTLPSMFTPPILILCLPTPMNCKTPQICSVFFYQSQFIASILSSFSSDWNSIPITYLSTVMLVSLSQQTPIFSYIKSINFKCISQPRRKYVAISWVWVRLPKFSGSQIYDLKTRKHVLSAWLQRRHS